MKKIIAIFAVFALMCGSVIPQNAPKGGSPASGAKAKKVVKPKTMAKPPLNKKSISVNQKKPVAKPSLNTNKK